ncbi:MAG: MFS transporter [Actinomycetota bacterium]
MDSRRAWLVVVATFLSSFFSLGVTYSFGAFFTDMAAEFGSARGETAVIFGITTWAFFWLSLITGRAADVWGPRPVLLVGAVGMLVGLLATSRVDSLALGYLTYGAGMGIAAACGYIPMVAAVSGWFERYRATAVGIAVAGIGAGTLVMSPVSAALIDRYGWRDTFVILAVVGAAAMGLCTLLVDRPPGQPGPQPARFGDAFRSGVFRRMHLSALCSGLALFVPFVFVGQYAEEQGVSSVAAAILVGLLGGASILARIGFGTAVERIGSVRLYRFCFVLLSLGFVIWLGAGGSYAMLVVFVLVLGIGYGGFVALSTIVMAERFGVVGLGSVLGLFYTSQGLGGLIGPPTAGWLIDRTDGYAAAIVVCIALTLTARLLLFRLPVTDGGALAPEPVVIAMPGRSTTSS